jgi:hypothetical protein
MSKSHNKKRNVGIIYEQLLRVMAESLIAEETEKYNNALGIIRKHFKSGTQLYREFRLFNALVKTSVVKEVLAVRILQEAKLAALDFDSSQLRKEKAALIKDINYTLADPSFYNRRINEYREYATIQTLLNDWRATGNTNLTRVSNYENKVCDLLLSEKHSAKPVISEDQDVSALAVRLMTEKFNKRYGRQLNDEQQVLIREYVFNGKNASTKDFQVYLNEIKANLMTELDIYGSTCKNEVLNEKMNKVQSAIISIDTGVINDATVSQFLLASQLKSEITGGNDE